MAKEIHNMIKLLKVSSNIENFDLYEREIFYRAYRRMHTSQQVVKAVDNGLELISRMLKNDWDTSMTHCSVEMLVQEINNTFLQKIVLQSIVEHLEYKYFKNCA